MAGNGRSGGEDVVQPLVVLATHSAIACQDLASHRWLKRGHHVDVDTKQLGQFPVQPGQRHRPRTIRRPDTSAENMRMGPLDSLVWRRPFEPEYVTRRPPRHPLCAEIWLVDRDRRLVPHPVQSQVSAQGRCRASGHCRRFAADAVHPALRLACPVVGAPQGELLDTEPDG